METILKFVHLLGYGQVSLLILMACAVVAIAVVFLMRIADLFRYLFADKRKPISEFGLTLLR